MTAFSSIAFAPAMPWSAIAGLAVAILLVVGYGLYRRAPGIGWRLAVLFGLLAAIANPSLIEEDRKNLTDTALVVVDRSASQGIGERTARAEAALNELRGKLEPRDDMTLRVVEISDRAAGGGSPSDGTLLFGALDNALMDVPRDRLAGVVMLTDGQVHDVPTAGWADKLGAPLHVLLTGEPDESDRRLVVEQAPSYGVVGDILNLTLRVEDSAPDSEGSPVEVEIRLDGGEVLRFPFRIGQSKTVPLELTHAGPTIVEMSVNLRDGELTERNNRSVVAVQGVRDRLRVLLVSGEPHAGERIWRNLLKADPSVDLVHFTILRPPEKQDGTPIRELSLIAFPIRQLFEVKLNDFDLVIFDHYRRRGVLPYAYLQNITNYVMDGGAVLEAAGPAFATPLSLYRTPLSAVLPGRPSGEVVVQGFRPRLTDTGRRHPVTASLPGAANDPPEWGRWFRMIEVEQTSGHALMAGLGERPILLLDRIGEGRVAQLASDHAWLWARGFEGGGPQAELLRRLAHWLMKEPELEEESLTAEIRDGRLSVEQRSLNETPQPVTVTLPSGETRRIPLEPGEQGLWYGAMDTPELGLYRLNAGKMAAVAAAGPLNAREFEDVRTSAEVLTETVAASGGGIHWLRDGLPDLRRTKPGRNASGRNWIGLVDHQAYLVTGIRQAPLLPALLVLLLVLGGLAAAWYREGR